MHAFGSALHIGGFVSLRPSGSSSLTLPPPHEARKTTRISMRMKTSDARSIVEVLRVRKMKLHTA